ncbi:FtsW/RodA/SpoVE family cell cycle protein [Bacillus sp. SL00103]
MDSMKRRICFISSKDKSSGISSALVSWRAHTFDYESLLERLSFRLFAGGIFLIILVHFFGTSQNGSQRWISFGSIKVQPSEFMKIFVILLLAAVLNQYKHQRSLLKKAFPTSAVCWTVVPFFPHFSSAYLQGQRSSYYLSPLH